MSHIVRTLDWGVIDLDTHSGRIFFQQTWFYRWDVATGASPWTLAEKRAFHHALDRQVWGHWSMRFRFVPHGRTAFAQKFRSGLPIDLDVKWVLKPGDFTIHAVKRPPPVNHNIRPNVDFVAKVINLSMWDTGSYKALNDAGKSSPHPFQPIPHEFGHALGTPNDDEYVKGNPHLSDTDSIMNIGGQVRARHLETIRAELNTMVPHVTFSILGPHHGHLRGIGRTHTHKHTHVP